MGIRINYLNYPDYFPKKSMRVQWNSLMLLPGGRPKPRTMKSPNSYMAIRYYTPEDIIKKMEFRIKNSQPKNREMYGYKWDYIIDIAKKLKLQEEEENES